jgi:hypothetical protein
MRISLPCFCTPIANNITWKLFSKNVHELQQHIEMISRVVNACACVYQSSGFVEALKDWWTIPLPKSLQLEHLYMKERTCMPPNRLWPSEHTPVSTSPPCDNIVTRARSRSNVFRDYCWTCGQLLVRVIYRQGMHSNQPPPPPLFFKKGKRVRI